MFNCSIVRVFFQATRHAASEETHSIKVTYFSAYWMQLLENTMNTVWKYFKRVKMNDCIELSALLFRFFFFFFFLLTEGLLSLATIVSDFTTFLKTATNYFSSPRIESGYFCYQVYAAWTILEECLKLRFSAARSYSLYVVC